MSVQSLAIAKGSRVTVVRPVYAAASGGSQVVGSYTSIATSVPVVLQPEPADRALKLYGIETDSQVFTGFTAYREDIVKNDRMVVTSTGYQNGERFQVVDVRPFKMGVRSHVELGLVSTTETW